MPASDDADFPPRPAPREPGAAANGEAGRADADRSAAVASRDGEAEAKHRRPMGLIALCGVLVLAVVGLGIWALSAQSDANDTQKRLDAATAAAAGKASQSQEPTATPQATATATAPPAATPDAATQQAINELTAALGATNENLADIQKDLENAAAEADAAREAKADASNALERTKADLQGFKADAQLATACLRGVLEAVKTAFSSGGTQAALDQATALAGSCRGAAS